MEDSMPYCTIEDIQQEITKYTLHQGRVFLDTWAQPTLTIVVEMKVRDVRPPHEETSLSNYTIVHIQQFEEEPEWQLLLSFIIEELVKQTFLHEAHEALKKDGVHVVDPHPKLRPRR